jgi:NAD(P)-dependent dehydrogenase (short-subunit alcohol dehydrogenase family)
MKPLNEQTILITGSTDGLGKIAAIQLARKNAHVIIHGRNPEKVTKVVEEIKHECTNHSIEGITADFSSLAAVRKMAAEIIKRFSAIDVLINNAGVGFADERYGKDGYELRFAVNYLAPYLLTHLILPVIKKSAPSRIVNVSSAGQAPVNFEDIMMENHFDAVQAYCQSKLALIMFTIDLAEQLKDDNITVNALHPGTYLDTNMVRRANIPPRGTVESGADAEVYLACSEKLDSITGRYFNVKTETRAEAQAYDNAARERLRSIAIKITGVG